MINEQQKNRDFQKLEKIVSKLEEYHDKGELTSSILSKMQDELDNIARIYQYDAHVGSEKSYLYELQALILLARGDEASAESCMIQAAEISGDPPSFLSEAGKKWYASYIINNETFNTEHEVIGSRINRLSFLFSYLFAYFLFFTVILVTAFITGFITGTVSDNVEQAGRTVEVVTLILQLPLFIYLLITSQRRLNDMNHSGWWILVPIINIYFALLCLFKPGDDEANNYGTPPTRTHIVGF